MAREKRSYPPEARAQAVAAILAGTSVAEAARQFNVPESTIRTWADADGADFAAIRAEKKEKLEGLISEYLTEGLITLREQLKVARDPEYLKKQNAEAFGVMHGIFADKLLRVIEAYAASQPLTAEPQSQSQEK